MPSFDRMVSYIHQAHPRTEEMLVDEMLPDSSRATPLCGSATSPGASYGCQPGAAGACPLGSSAGAYCAEIETWRQKKESQEAQARYNSWLYYKKWNPDEEE